MTAAPHRPLVERVAKALAKAAFPSRGWDDLADYEKTVYLADAHVALDACHAEEMLEVLRWYASDEAYRTEGLPGDTVYDRMRRPERVLQDRGQRARALLARLDGRS